MRDKIFSFSYCLMDRFPGTTTFMPCCRDQIIGLRTEGIIRLLTGTPIRMHPNDLAKMPADYNTQPVDPIDIREAKAVIWSPMADAWPQHCGTARCDDGSIYPIVSAEVRAACGVFDFKVLVSELRCFWLEFIRLTADVPKRLFVGMNTELLFSGEFRTHVTNVLCAASEEFARAGWAYATPRPDIGPDGYWLHHTTAEIARFHDQVRRYIEL